MANGASNYLSNMALNAIFKVGTFTEPTHLYVALCTVAPTASNTGTTITEVTGGSYARAQLDPSSSTNWVSSSAESTDNSVQITFPTATGSYSGAVVGYCLCDASTAGNMLYFGTCTSVTITSGMIPTILIAGIVVNMS